MLRWQIGLFLDAAALGLLERSEFGDLPGEIAGCLFSIDLNPGLSEGEIEKLIGTRDYTKFLNFRNELYRERKMKTNPPPRAEAAARATSGRRGRYDSGSCS